MNDDRERVAYHEAGHGAVAHVLGRRIELLSVRPGAHYAGIAPYLAPRVNLNGNGSLHLPAILQPGQQRRALETRMAVALAGEIAEELVGPRSGYVPASRDERMTEKLARSFTGLSRRQTRYLEGLEKATDLEPDQEAAWGLAWILSGDEAASHLAYIRAVTRRIVYSPSTQRGIAALADALLDREVLSGRTAREILKEASERR